MKMKKKFTLGLFLFGTGFAFSQCANTNNIYTFTFDGKTYEVVKEAKTWTAAAACAVERGGYLVEINNVSEQNAIYDAIVNGAGISPSYASVPDGGDAAYIWIGATDQQTEGTWKWDGNNDNQGTQFWNGEGLAGSGNGAPTNSAYHNWGGKNANEINEPDNYGNQNYGAIGLGAWPAGMPFELGTGGEWNDLNGDNNLYFIIEKDGGSTNGLNVNPQNDQKFSIFPNPSNGNFKIDGNFQSAKIYDIRGKQILETDASNSEIILSNIQKGTYFIEIKNEETIFITQLIIE